ncbi:MAG TPA: hypothetical protein VJH95_03030 [Candidatus Nanoarchaeia archaeon]|nr:hypothetical protein [Candidatus Nanoarchaeia archaeon]
MKFQQQILEKVDYMEKEIKAIKSRMVDQDSVMTEEDYKALLNYRNEKSSGKLVAHRLLKKELGL